MKLAKWYLNLDINRKIVFWLIVLPFIVFVCLVPLFFIHGENGYPFGAYPLGWLVGSICALISFLLIVLMTSSMLPFQSQPSKSSFWVFVSVFSFFGRFALYAAALAISGICTFKSEWFGGFNAFNFYTTAAALVLMPILVACLHFIDSRHASKIVDTSKEKKAGK